MSETVTRLVEGQHNGECQLVITTSWPERDEWPDQVETIDAYGTFHSLDMMKRANESGGFHFFSRGAMRFFRSRVAPGVTHGRVFVTSEQFDYSAPRLYTVRAMRDDGSTVELCEFQQFATLALARAYVRNIYATKGN